MTSHQPNDSCITLHRRFLVEARTTPLLSAAQERRLAQRIDTARRRLLATLAAWPGCVPGLLADYAQAVLNVRRRERIIVGIHDLAPDDSHGPGDLAASIAVRLTQLAESHRLYLDSLAAHGWEHYQTRLRRRAVAAHLCGLRLHDNCLRRLLALSDTDPPARLGLPCALLRGRIAAGQQALQALRQYMVNANLRLVASVARRYRFCPVAQVDLIQEGNLGLLRAVEKFDYRRGCKFSTYAIWWIQRAMVLAITLQRSALSVPAYAMQAAHRSQRRAARELLAGGPVPSIDELAAAESMPAADLRAAFAACLPAVALHGETDDETAPINTLHDHQQPDPAEILMQAQLRQQLQTVLATLPPRQAHVLRLRYGLGVDEPHTLDAIGQQLGLSRERIRQIEQQALNRLRKGAYRAHLAPLLDTPEQRAVPPPQSSPPWQGGAS